jgi:hypothetical protein
VAKKVTVRKSVVRAVNSCRDGSENQELKVVSNRTELQIHYEVWSNNHGTSPPP